MHTTAPSNPVVAVSRKKIWREYKEDEARLAAHCEKVWEWLVGEVRRLDVSDLTFYGSRFSAMSGGVWRDIEIPPFHEDSYVCALAMIVSGFAGRPELLERLEEKTPEIDAAIVKCGKRFRINVNPGFLGFSASLRPMPDSCPEPDKVGFDTPETKHLFNYLTNLDSGIILVTGATGSGKSTTMAAMLNSIRCLPLADKTAEDRRKIITLEDPIEYLFPDEAPAAIVKQREIGEDCDTFAAGMRSALREKPNIILLGELRDGETIKTALTAAETGHLVISTLHTFSVENTLERFIRTLPEADRQEGRLVLAFTLRAIISQRLPRTKTGGRVAWREVLTAEDPATSTLIANRKDFELPDVMRRNRALGMCRFADSLAVLRPKLHPGEMSKAEAFLETVKQTN